jgi:hypothetical protein
VLDRPVDGRFRGPDGGPSKSVLFQLMASLCAH